MCCIHHSLEAIQKTFKSYQLNQIFFFPSKLQLFPQAPLSAWSARTGAPYVRPSPDWSWRTSGSSVCGMSFRQPTAARTGRSTSSPAVISDAAAACIRRGTIRSVNRFWTGQESLSLSFQKEVRKRKCWCRWSDVLDEWTRGHMTRISYTRTSNGRAWAFDAVWAKFPLVLTRLNSAVRKTKRYSRKWTLVCCRVLQKWTLWLLLKIVCVRGLWQYVPVWACLFISGF